ncbi:hypothetical protein [Azotobacter beijerinckii]|nr:hypothetical protein [Azotobacter beijerinckii]
MRPKTFPERTVMANMRDYFVRWLSPGHWLLIGATLYALMALIVQLSGTARTWHGASPLEISSTLVASLGVAFAVFQTISKWNNHLVRRYWVIAGAGMLLIWAGEVAVDKIKHVDFRLIVLIWASAAVLLFRCIRPYLTESIIEKSMWVGAAAQITAHVAWTVKDGFLGGGVHLGLQMVIDSGELLSLLGYTLAMALARLSRLDDHAIRDDRLQRWTNAASKVSGQATRPRICFPYIAQVHQIFHSLPIAAALAQRYPDIEVHIAGSRHNLRLARRLLRDQAGSAPLHFDQLYHPWSVRIDYRDGAVGGKKKILRANRLYFSGFDAIVIPERTSTYLRKICPPSMKLIGTEHGAGDREVTFDPAIALFDFLLLGGEKQARRLIELGYTAPGRFVAGIYAKLDWTTRRNSTRPRMFGNGRPTVLYNPHFDESLSSWPLIGRQVLDHFARSTTYNLIFAPHIRLFDTPTPAKYEAFREYQKYPHMHIDLGSEHCADMTYTLAADIYLGDVSSQVVEFLTQPRPCLFLNPRQVAWQDDLHYRFWQLGTVLTDIDGLDTAIDNAVCSHRDFEQRQRDYLRDTLGLVEPGQSGARGAEAIVGYLQKVERSYQGISVKV